MEIRLSPELEAVVERDMASGRYGSLEEYITEAVELLHERDQWRGETLDEQRERLESAWHQAERGELMGVEEVRQEMTEMKAAWMARRKSA